MKKSSCAKFSSTKKMAKGGSTSCKTIPLYTNNPNFTLGRVVKKGGVIKGKKK